MNYTSSNIKQQLTSTLKYTSIESALYQLILFIHYIALYKYVDQARYGIIGAIFSWLYILVLYLNVGLDLTVAPMFHIAKQSQQHMKNICSQLLGNVLLAICASLVLPIICPFYALQFSSIEYFFFALVIISETIKKTLKMLLHLALFHRSIALIEISSLLIYLTIIWGFLLSNHEASLLLIFGSLTGISLTIVCIYSYKLLTWYHQQLSTHSLQTSISHAHIIKKMLPLRIKHFYYQFSRTLYSPNFLIPLIGIYYSIELAGFLKIISMGAHACNTVIRQTFSITTLVLCSSSQDTLSENKKNIFYLLQHQLYKVLLCLGAYLIVHYCFIQLLYTTIITKEEMYIGYIFIALLFTEQIAIVYENVLIMENSSTFLTIINSLLIMSIMLIHKYMNNNILHALTMLLIIRFLYLIIIYCYVHYVQNTHLARNTQTTYNEESKKYIS